MAIKTGIIKDFADWLRKIAGWTGADIGSVGDILDNAVRQYTGSGLTDSQIEANEFTAGQQEDAQAHDIEMANLNAQLSQQYFDRNLSPSAQVQQYKDAGLNPALMYSKGASVSSAPASFGSSSSGQGSSVSPGSAGLMDLMKSIVGMSIQAKEAKANIALKNAQAHQTNVLADLQHEQMDYISKDYELRSALQSKNIEDIDSQIAWRASQNELVAAHISEADAHSSWYNMQTDLGAIDRDYKAQVYEHLFALQEQSVKKSIAEEKLAYAKTDTEKQKYKEQLDSYEARMDEISANAYKALAEAGIKGNELAYWSDQKHLEAAAIQAKVINDLKLKTPFGFEYRPFNVMRSMGMSDFGQPFVDNNPYQMSISSGQPVVFTESSLPLFKTYSDRINARKGWTKRLDRWREREFNVYPIKQ